MLLSNKAVIGLSLALIDLNQLHDETLPSGRHGWDEWLKEKLLQ